MLIVGVGVGISAGDEVTPAVVLGSAMTRPVAWDAGCNATMALIENNSNAELITRARKTHFTILVDFLNPFMKPRL
jgi:hypothetical protein